MPSKVCTICNIEKDESEFEKPYKNSENRRADCRICHNEMRRQKNKENPSEAMIIKV